MPLKTPAAAILSLAAGALLAVTPTPAANYSSTVTADGPLAFYPLNDSIVRANVNTNIGSLGATANATNLNVRAFPGAIVGDRNRATFFDSTARALIPYLPDLNPPETQPFTMEAWFYPGSDQINGGQAVINNRYAYNSVRQGWVIFQRNPNENYNGKAGSEGIGWNFRMYAGGTGIDVVTATPYQVGSWVHFVAVYDPDAANGKTTTVYINGVEAASRTGNYIANTDDHPASEAPNGPAKMAFGAYNNTASSTPGVQPQSNPYFGGIDEFAFYKNVLTPEKILAHYQNATNAARTIAYDALIQSDAPVAYLRMDELPPDTGTYMNLGELRNNGSLVINNKVQRNSSSALSNEWADASIGTHRRNGGGTRANIPFAALNNPPESQALTIETWVRALNDRVTPGAAIMNNRKASGNRSGWVIFQRNPNSTYNGVPSSEGIGWNLRLYKGSAGASADITTGVAYTVGEWQHVVFTWAPIEDNGDGLTWSGTLTAYVNGEQVAQTVNSYHANTNPTDDGSTPVDLAIGSYNAASNWGQEFDGNLDEVAIYNNYALTADQVLEHYSAGTNSHPITNYSALVLSAPFNGSLDQGLPTKQDMGPATYLRFNDPAPFPAANAGTLGPLADGVFQAGGNNTAAGPAPTAFGGFDAANLAGIFDGTLGWLSLNDPPALEISGNITLEAWVKPAATQAARARIISHGPSLLSLYLPTDPIAQIALPFTSPEVFLQMDNSGANYTVGSSDGTNTFAATAAVPAADLSGSAWVYLAGTYDGANWKLYRNGALVATTASTTGALPVPHGDWAIASAGEGWTDYFAGSIDNPAIYNKALTAAQILQHYNSGVGTAAELKITITSRTVNSMTISWTGGSGKYLIQKKTDLGSPTWTNFRSTTGTSTTITTDGTTGFFRIQDNYTGPDIP
jgi:hypothetical protein